jgi:hypothetical protein
LKRTAILPSLTRPAKQDDGDSAEKAEKEKTLKILAN